MQCRMFLIDFDASAREKSQYFPTCQVRLVRFYVSLISSSLPPPHPATICSVPCRSRTSTAIICGQCSLPDLNHEAEDLPDRTPETMSEDMSEECQKACQKRCQNECQTECQEWCKECQTECQKRCQKECQKFSYSQFVKLRVAGCISTSFLAAVGTIFAQMLETGHILQQVCCKLLETMGWWICDIGTFAWRHVSAQHSLGAIASIQAGWRIMTSQQQEVVCVAEGDWAATAAQAWSWSWCESDLWFSALGRSSGTVQNSAGFVMRNDRVQTYRAHSEPTHYHMFNNILHLSNYSYISTECGLSNPAQWKHFQHVSLLHLYWKVFPFLTGEVQWSREGTSEHLGTELVLSGEVWWFREPWQRHHGHWVWRVGMTRSNLRRCFLVLTWHSFCELPRQIAASIGEISPAICQKRMCRGKALAQDWRPHCATAAGDWTVGAKYSWQQCQTGLDLMDGVCIIGVRRWRVLRAFVVRSLELTLIWNTCRLHPPYGMLGAPSRKYGMPLCWGICLSESRPACLWLVCAQASGRRCAYMFERAWLLFTKLWWSTGLFWSCLRKNVWRGGCWQVWACLFLCKWPRELLSSGGPLACLCFVYSKVFDTVSCVFKNVWQAAYWHVLACLFPHCDSNRPLQCSWPAYAQAPARQHLHDMYLHGSVWLIKPVMKALVSDRTLGLGAEGLVLLAEIHNGGDVNMAVLKCHGGDHSKKKLVLATQWPLPEKPSKS